MKKMFFLLFLLLNFVAEVHALDPEVFVSVVKIWCKQNVQERTVTSLGTGFPIKIEDKTVWIMTAAHCVSNNLEDPTIQTFYPFGEEELVAAKIIWRSNGPMEGLEIGDYEVIELPVDVAILKAEFKNRPRIKSLLFDPPAAKNQPCYRWTVGCARRERPTAILIQKINWDILPSKYSHRYVPTFDAGKSGSPVLNGNNNVVGIVQYQRPSYDDKLLIGGAQPSTRIWANLPPHLRHLMKWNCNVLHAPTFPTVRF